MLHLECTAVGICLKCSVLTYNSDIWHNYNFAVKCLELCPGHLSLNKPIPPPLVKYQVLFIPYVPVRTHEQCKLKQQVGVMIMP